MSFNLQKSGTCKNCGRETSGTFCAHCGQKTNTVRFQWRHLGNQILDSFDFDRGFVFTFVSLVIRPGSAILDYLEGRRVKYSNPFKLFIIIGALATFLVFELQLFSGEATAIVGNSINLQEMENKTGFTEYSGKYFSFFSLTSLLSFALFSWLFFNGNGFNYIEHFILNTYIAVGQFIVLLIFVPMIYMLNSAPYILIIYGAVNFVYNVWALTICMRGKSWSGLLKSTIAVVVPVVITYHYNYFIYLHSPREIWGILD